MKYKIGDIVLLYSGEDMYIYDIDKNAKAYYVVNNSNSKDMRKIKDSEIFQKIMTI